MIPTRASRTCVKRKVAILDQVDADPRLPSCLEYMHKLLTEFSQANTVPLRLNHDSPIYKTFAT